MKTRSSNRFGAPVEAVVPSKVLHLRRAAEHYLLDSLDNQAVHFMVISVKSGDGLFSVEECIEIEEV